MIGAVAGKELRQAVRDRRLVWTAGIVLVLLAVAVLVGWQAQAENARQVAAARQADRAAWLDQGPRGPHSAAHFGQYAFKPTSPLSWVDRGVDAQTGVALWMEAHYQDPASFRPAADRTALARFGELTAATVLRLLVPLLIVLLAFGAVAGERERGTWRQQLAQGARARDLVLGKLLGLGGALLLPLVPVALLGAAGLVIAGGGTTGLPDLGARAALLALGYLLYFVAWLGLALAVSALAPSSRSALLVLVGLWMANGLLLPRLAADLSERLYPAPTASEFWQLVKRDMEAGIDWYDPADARLARLQREALEKYGVDDLEDLPVNFDAIALMDSEAFADRVYDRRWGELWATWERQERLQSWAGLAAPALAVRGLSMGMAGTDLAQQRHFVDAAEAHRRQINLQLNEHMMRHAGQEGFAWMADPSFWAQVPELTYRLPGIGLPLARHARDLLLLVLWGVAGPLLAVVAVQRAPDGCRRSRATSPQPEPELV